jgi:hypothetical protein
MMMAERAVGIHETINGCGILVGKSQGTRCLGRPWHRWDDNVDIYGKESVLSR